MRGRVVPFTPPANGHQRDHARAVVGSIQRDIRRPMASWRSRHLRGVEAGPRPPDLSRRPDTVSDRAACAGETPAPPGHPSAVVWVSWPLLLFVLIVVALTTWTVVGALGGGR